MVIISKVYPNLNSIDHLSLVRLEDHPVLSIIVPLAPEYILAYSSSKPTNKQTVDLMTVN